MKPSPLQDKFFQCSCYSHSLLVEKNEDMAAISFFSRGFDGYKLGFWQRIKWCFRILFKGFPYTDMVLLKKDQIRQLVKFLNEF